MRAPDEVAIETPEQIELMLEPAGLGSRFVAWVLDVLIKLAALVGLFLLAAVLAALMGLDLAAWINSPGGVVMLLLLLVLLMGYDVYFEVRHNGQTPGKRRQGIRVLREGGGPVDFRSAALRSLLVVADFLPIFYLLGATLVLLTRRRQRLGDLAAGTLVIRERAAAPPADQHDLVERLASPEYVFTPDQLAACAPADRHVLRSFFQRYREMERRPRHELAGRLARVFLTRTGFRAPAPLFPGPEAESFLASLYRDLENWSRHGR